VQFCRASGGGVLASQCASLVGEGFGCQLLGHGAESSRFGQRLLGVLPLGDERLILRQVQGWPAREREHPDAPYSPARRSG